MDISEYDIDLDTYKRVVIQLDSLNRLKVSTTNIDLFIIDEYESVLS